jgi:fucose permease
MGADVLHASCIAARARRPHNLSTLGRFAWRKAATHGFARIGGQAGRVPERDQTSIARVRLSVTALFFIFGAASATWVSRIPGIQHRLGLSAAQLGIALLAQPAGAVLAARCAPALIRRLTSATTARWAVLAGALCLAPLGLARSMAALAAGLALLGMSMGTLDIAMNTQGVALERTYRRPLMSRLHGLYSAGVLAGALLGAGAAGAGISPLAHFAIAGGVVALVGFLATKQLLGRPADTVDDQLRSHDERSDVLYKHPVLLAAGIITFCSFFAEGAVDNWSGVFLHQVRHAPYAIAALGVGTCGLAMAIGRLGGDAIIQRWGRTRTLLCASLLATTGMTLALVGGSVISALAGYAVFGLGAATIVPIAFSVGGQIPGIAPPRALGFVTTVGYVGFVASPALIGLVAHAIGLSRALAIPTLLLLLVAPLSYVARGN